MKPQNIHRWLLLFVLGTSLLAPPAPAQQSVPGADPSLTPESAQEEQEAVFEIEIEEVTVPITVTDSSGEFVTDLNLSDFRVFDNNREQRISEFELSWEPISMVVVVETSSRVASMLPEIGRSGILFTQLILGESGEAAVIAFDSDVQVVQEFTDNPDLVE
ncbi:MAG TPA: hypothetical protein VIC04_00010, partial [Terriglobia bacterium]